VSRFSLHLRPPCVLLLAVCALGASAASATAAPGDYFDGRVGVSSHLVWHGSSEAAAEMRRLKSGSVDWVREDFRWDLVEPAPGSFDWRRTDNLMAAAAQSGVDVLGVLGYSARWASSDPSGGGDIHYPPRDPADYARYALAVVERYGRNGTFWISRPDLPQRPLTAVELWNEPWGFWFWKPNPDPAAYARLARAGAEAINAVRPETTVLISGDILTFRSDDLGGRWLSSVLAADPGLGGLIDAYSTHPYPSPRDRSPLDTSSGPDFRFNRAHLTNEAAAPYGAVKPIWITEVGWSTAAGVSDAVSEATQADYLAKATAHALSVQNVARMFVFSWTRSSGAAGDREGNYGLQRVDGSLKPAWPAIVDVVRNGPGKLLSGAPGKKPKARAAAACVRKSAGRRGRRRHARLRARWVRISRARPGRRAAGNRRAAPHRRAVRCRRLRAKRRAARKRAAQRRLRAARGGRRR
jgi:polysaccharide biosynthesis protein PslG